METPQGEIAEILGTFESHLGKDFEKYSNHVNRVFLLCLALDEKEEHRLRYAIAAAFHDLGIWTENTFDYLKPSIVLARQYLLKINKEEWIEEISLMIDMHHKRSKYQGAHHKTVETFRRADWIDVTKGRRTFSVSKAKYGEMISSYPTVGFHGFLVALAIKNFFKSPLNPLPMFKS